MSTLIISCHADAHTLMVSRGELQVFTDVVQVNLEVAAEDVLHFEPRLHDEVRQSHSGQDGAAIGRQSFMMSAESAAQFEAIAARYGDVLAGALRVFDETGARINCAGCRLLTTAHCKHNTQSANWANATMNYSCSCPTTNPPRLLTLALSPENNPLLIHWQMVLSVPARGWSSGACVRLTSGGNFETIRLEWIDGTARAVPAEDDLCAPDGLNGTVHFKEVISQIVVQDRRVDIWISIPLLIMESWIPLPRANPNCLSLTEQSKAIPSIQNWLAGILALSNDHAPVPLTVGGSLFAGAMQDAFPHSAADGPVNMAAGRIVAQLSADLSESPTHVLKWMAFNQRVLFTRARLMVNGVCREHRFSTYTPSLVLH